MNEAIGFVVHASYDSSHGTRIFLVGRLETGATFAAIVTRFTPRFYVRKSDETETASTTARKEHTQLRTIDGEEVDRLSFNTVQEMQNAASALKRNMIRVYESDLRIYDSYLLDKQIYGPISLSGEADGGRHVDRVYIDPIIEPVAAENIPWLRYCSIDIENDPESREIFSIALASRSAAGSEPASEVLYSGDDDKVDSAEWIFRFSSERELLQGFMSRIQTIDPDIITGWNVIEYDFELIAERFRHYGIPFDIGRSDRKAAYMPGDKSQSSAIVIPGRQVVDGMRVMRSSPLRFFDNRLDTVAREVLGTGKVHLGPSKLEAILDSYRSDPIRFCEYNRRDAELVNEILETSGMLELTIRRSVLTGMPLSRAWTSVAAFEQLYIGRLHNAKMVAPDHGIDTHTIGRAPGGAIIPPRPGLFQNVLVFDFKSLYPSIIRTFNIDPASYIPPERIEVSGDVVEAPNGAAFRRDISLLPDILAEFFKRRDEAKRKGDASGSYVYKIIMNSFYGVLGTPGCRFAASDIAGAITSFGHEMLAWSRRFFESKGYEALYGDTDSLFIQGDAKDADTELIERRGAELAKEATEKLSAYVTERWGVASHLELEFEYLYLQFFLPALRGSSGTRFREVDVAALQGRAKGYAGLRSDDGEIEIKGMEAIRRDWTEAAKQLQRMLLASIFSGEGPESIERTVVEYIESIENGRMNDTLIYFKALRKSADSYTRNKPPHVRAAMHLPPSERRGLIPYLWTIEGPIPPTPNARGDGFEPFAGPAIDYAHYIEKQIRPIVEGVGDVIGHNFSRVFDRDPQRELF